jgi:hypothetical protein
MNFPVLFLLQYIPTVCCCCSYYSVIETFSRCSFFTTFFCTCNYPVGWTVALCSYYSNFLLFLLLPLQRIDCYLLFMLFLPSLLLWFLSLGMNCCCFYYSGSAYSAVITIT